MVTRKGISSESTLPLPKPEEVKLAEMDFEWSAKNKTALVKKMDRTVPGQNNTKIKFVNKSV